MMRAKMDLITAVEYLEASIDAGRNQFFANTEFGVIGVEFNNSMKYDPMVPVEIIPWVHAPRTSWAMQVRNRPADYYMSIDVTNSKASNHLHVVEGMIRCMLRTIIGFYPDSRIVDAAVILYEKICCNKSWTINSLEKEFCKVNLGALVANNKVVRMLVRDMITRRIIDSEDILKESRGLLKNYSNVDQEFPDDFYKSIFGLVLFTIKKFPERISDINPLMLDIVNNKHNGVVVSVDFTQAKIAVE